MEICTKGSVALETQINGQGRSVAMFWKRSCCALFHCHPTPASALFIFAIKLMELLDNPFGVGDMYKA